MSRYASARDGEKVQYPGYFTGYAAREVVEVHIYEQFRDPELVRRHLAARVRHAAVQGYDEARRKSLEGPSHGWMRPHGRPRFRWVRRDPATVDGLSLNVMPLYEIACVVYPQGALP